MFKAFFLGNDFFIRTTSGKNQLALYLSLMLPYVWYVFVTARKRLLSVDLLVHFIAFCMLVLEDYGLQ